MQVQHVSQHQHNIDAVCQMTHVAHTARESPDFKRCSWESDFDMAYPFAYAHNEFVWNADVLSKYGEAACDDVVAPQSLTTTKSQACRMVV